MPNRSVSSSHFGAKMPVNSNKRTSMALIAVATLMGLILVSTVLLVAKQASDQEWVEHTYQVQSELSRIAALLQDAEGAQRGYLITDRPRFFDEFQKATGAVGGEIDRLGIMITDNLTQVVAVNGLRELAATRLAFLGQAVNLQKSGKADEATALIKTGRGKTLMDQGNDALRLMSDEEERLLAERRRASRLSSVGLQAAVGLSVVTALAIGMFVLRQMRARVTELSAANEAMRVAAEQTAAETAKRAVVEDQLRQSQKMEAVGQLTGGLAHDFNNMLAIVIGSLDMAKRRTARGVGDVGRLLDAALEGAQRAAVLTQRLLAFSRQQPLLPMIVDANALVSGMAELMRRSLGEAVRLETVQGGGLWRVAVDCGQLEQSIVNLAVNSRDAMGGDGRLTIETFNAALDDAYSDKHLDVPPGQYIVIAVSDNGSGMPPEVVARAFDPFFTTKPVGQGTGLGLSQVFGFVKQSGGHVKIYSEPGHGTTVKIYLPRYRGEALPQAAGGLPESKDAVPTGSANELILVVEDEERVRHMAVGALRDLGYTVVHANGGKEALTMLERHEGVRLLFTDVVMPDMNGRELANIVQSRRGDIKILYTTGYTRNAVIHDGKLDTDVNFLPKPFTISQLAAKVRKVMDQTADSGCGVRSLSVPSGGRLFFIVHQSRRAGIGH